MSAKHAYRGVVATGLVTIATAGVAVAAHPINGATYTGSWGTPPQLHPVTFKVSANGKTVSHFVIAVALFHCGGFPGAAGSVKSASTTVSKKGTFKATLSLNFRHHQVGTLLVTGTFLKHGKERGRLSSKYTAPGYSTACDLTANYTTKG